jgi:hypothetical protein
MPLEYCDDDGSSVFRNRLSSRIENKEGKPIRMKHEVKNCTDIFSVICDIYHNKDKTLTFEKVVEAVHKAFKSNTNPPRTFELVIAPDVLAAIPHASDILVQNEFNFKTRFAELVTFKEKHGNCNVPTYGEDKVLGTWLSNMRTTYKKKKAGDNDTSGRILTMEQIAKLEELGVKWSLVATFEERFEELRAFKYKHRRCPKETDEGHKQLYEWLCTTRYAYKLIDTGKSSTTILSDGQMKLFATIGLVASFEEKLEELRAFKDKHKRLLDLPFFPVKISWLVKECGKCMECCISSDQ